MRVISHFIPFSEYELQNERWEKRIFCSPKLSFFPLGFSKYRRHLKRFSRCACVCELYLDSSLYFDFRMCLGISERPGRYPE